MSRVEWAVIEKTGGRPSAWHYQTGPYVAIVALQARFMLSAKKYGWWVKCPTGPALKMGRSMTLAGAKSAARSAIVGIEKACRRS
jgi:hypothetical protein